MRCLQRNLRDVKFSNYTGKLAIVDEYGYETGDYRNSYSDPVTVRGNVSPAKGSVYYEQFGTDVTYDRVIVSDDTSLNIDENSVIFLDVTPNANLSNYDYIVKRVARSLNVTSIAILKVDAK